MGAPLVGLSDVQPGMTVISGAPHSLRDRFGESYGPRGIREHSLPLAQSFDRAEEGLIDVSTGRTLIRPTHSPLVDVGDFNSYPSDVMKATEGIAGGVSEVVMRGGFSSLPRRRPLRRLPVLPRLHSGPWTTQAQRPGRLHSHRRPP